MATASCSCLDGFGNTGLSACQEKAKVAKGIIIVPTFKTDGTRNSLDVSTTINQSVITALLNNSDENLRWYPIQGIDNVEDVRGDNVTQDLNSGQSIFVQEGPRTFKGELIVNGNSPNYLKSLQTFNCQFLSAYIVDLSGNLIGKKESGNATEFFPIAIQSSTFHTKFEKATDSAVQMNVITFVWDATENDANIEMILSSETPDVNWLTQRGLLDVDVDYSSVLITTTTFTAVLTNNFGTAITKQPVEGLLLGDFTLAEKSPSPGALTISSVIESAAGVYDFVFTPAATSADVLTLTPSKDGFDFTDVVATDIDIP